MGVLGKIVSASSSHHHDAVGDTVCDPIDARGRGRCQTVARRNDWCRLSLSKSAHLPFDGFVKLAAVVIRGDAGHDFFASRAVFDRLERKHQLVCEINREIR